MINLIKILLLSTCLFASNVSADTNWYRVAANTGLVVDMFQTVAIAKDPNRIEGNPILGEHPEVDDVYKYFLVSMLLMNVAGELLPKPYGDYLYLSVAVVQTTVISHNHRVGVRISF